MNQQAEKMFMRRSEAMDFLGVTRAMFDKLRENQILKPASVKGMAQECFSRLHLQAVQTQLSGVSTAAAANDKTK